MDEKVYGMNSTCRIWGEDAEKVPEESVLCCCFIKTRVVEI
jgi:hypothetical protein